MGSNSVAVLLSILCVCRDLSLEERKKAMDEW